MKLWRDIDKRIWISDIETLKSCILLGFYNPDNEEKRTFEISEFKNDLYAFVNFYSKSNIDYVCGFNFKGFDAQVIEFILQEYEKWHELSNLETCAIIYRFVQDLIDDQNYNLRAKYYENQFTVDVIDVFLILGLNNEARRTSLKAAAFQTDGQVEEMPIHHSRENLTKEEIELVKSYMYNDIEETKRLLDIVIGNTKIKGYEGNNQLELRISIEEEFGLKCLNYSEITIGEELLKLKYAEAIGKNIRELPRKGTFRKEIKLKHCLPKYISFQTKQLQDLHKSIISTSVKMNDKLENSFKFYNTEYVQGLGGLHACNSNEIWESNDDYLLQDDDVVSFYPAILCLNGYYPYHLGKELLNVYKELYYKRLELKPLAKKDKRIKGIVEAYKLILNVCFGKMGSMESWLFDKQSLYSVTLTGQFSILILIEMLELEGIRVISANSDGITTYFHKDKLDKKKEIIKKWQEITNYEVETVNFKKFVYSTVNDYIAIKDDGEIKTKGDFEENILIHKNKSRNIVPLALKAYYSENKNVEEFIKNHQNPYDFMIRVKSSRDFHYEGYVSKKHKANAPLVTSIDDLFNSGWWAKTTGFCNSKLLPYTYLTLEEALKTENAWRNSTYETITNTNVYKKLIRYYVSNSGEKLMKIKNEDCQTNAVKAAQVEAGDYSMKVCNFIEKSSKITDFDINYQYYVDKTMKIINKIAGIKEAKKQPPNQISLF